MTQDADGKVAPSEVDPRVADLQIIEMYLKLVRDEERECADAYVNQLKSLHRGARPTSRPVSAQTPAGGRSAMGSGGIPTPTGGAQWDSTPRLLAVEDPLRVAKHCTGVLLEVFKELERIRAWSTTLHASLEVDPIQQAKGASPVHHDQTAHVLSSSRLHPTGADGREHPTTTHREVLEDIYAASGRAVAAVRSGMLFTTRILNHHVTSTAPQTILTKLNRLVNEECQQEDIRTHKNVEERATMHLNALGVRHLGSAQELLQQIPCATYGVLSWQCSLLPPQPAAPAPQPPSTPPPTVQSAGRASVLTPVPLKEAVVCSASHEAQQAPSRHVAVGPPAATPDRRLIKAAAVERVFYQSKQLCDALNINVPPRLSTPLTLSPRASVTTTPGRSSTKDRPSAQQARSVDEVKWSAEGHKVTLQKHRHVHHGSRPSTAADTSNSR